MRVIIAGCRDFNDYDFLKKKCDHLLKNQNVKRIVSGGARGVDRMAIQYAKERGYALKVYKANWNEFGKSAGPIRNAQMAEDADALIAFWDGKSKGTGNMIGQAYKKKLKVRTVDIRNGQ